MLGVDGFDFLVYLKREPRFTRVPQVKVTSDDRPETTHRALQSGAS